MMPSKKITFTLLGVAALLMGACSHVPSNITCVGPACGGGGGGGTGPFSIGGSIVGLTGTGLVLQNVGTSGTETLTIKGSGTLNFQFKTQTTGAYTVSVQAQPTGQVCAVSNGTGTAKANIANVAVSCGVDYTIGGTISGLLGTNLVLTDTVGTYVDTLPITGTGNSISFTFNTPVPANATYTVAVSTQPTGPAQTCQVTNGVGTATGNVSNVEILCPAPTYTIGGTLVGLVNNHGNGNQVELQNNSGDNIFVKGNNTSWIFPTAVTDNGHYNVSIFFDPTSQPQGCWIFYYEGVATANVNSVIVDCQHNDWTWTFGPDTTGNLGTYGLGQLPPPQPPAQNLNTPGGRDFPATWTDRQGQKWVFGGWGLPVAGVNPPFIPYFMNDLWVFSPGSIPAAGNNIWIPANLPIARTTTVSNGVTTIIDTTSNVPLQYPGDSNPNPSARWGSVTWTDSTTGDLYLFGGQDGAGVENDMYKFTPGPTLPNEIVPGGACTTSNLTPPGYDVSYTFPCVNPTVVYTGAYTYTGGWTKVNSGTGVNPIGGPNGGGNYPANPGGAGYPGARWGAAFYTDATGTVWMFGGQGFDGTGTLGLLNDLWKYSGGTWTWMGPANSNAGQKNGIYGQLGVAGAGNAPGGRQTAVLWADNAGSIWLFGGLGLDSVGTSGAGSLGGLPNGTTPNGALLNDLWQFNIGTGQWTWMSGGGATGLANQVGVYGTQQTAAAGQFPGSRWSAGGWADSSGNIWFFGGWGYASSLAQSTGFLNDVWEYIPSLNQWIWWKGSSNVNQNGNYASELLGVGPYYVPFIQNQPGARRGFGLWQQDADGYVWVLGGQGYDKTSASGNGYVNDMWTYLPFPYYPNN